MPIARINGLFMSWIGKLVLGVKWEDTVLWLGGRHCSSSKGIPSLTRWLTYNYWYSVFG